MTQFGGIGNHRCVIGAWGLSIHGDSAQSWTESHSIRPQAGNYGHGIPNPREKSVGQTILSKYSSVFFLNNTPTVFFWEKPGLELLSRTKTLTTRQQQSSKYGPRSHQCWSSDVTKVSEKISPEFQERQPQSQIRKRNKYLQLLRWCHIPTCIKSF